MMTNRGDYTIVDIQEGSGRNKYHNFYENEQGECCDEESIQWDQPSACDNDEVRVDTEVLVPLVVTSTSHENGQGDANCAFGVARIDAVHLETAAADQTINRDDRSGTQGQKTFENNSRSRQGSSCAHGAMWEPRLDPGSRVAIIGAGSAGLQTCKTLTLEVANFDGLILACLSKLHEPPYSAPQYH